VTPTNGAISDTLLVPAAHAAAAGRLRSGTASRWATICAQVAARYGWTPAIIAGGAYRPLADQVAIFTARYSPAPTGAGPFGDVRAWAGTRYVRTSGAPAAVPGTSNHGWGTAVDVDGLAAFDTPTYAQLAAVAVPLGFTNTEGRAIGEPWHWVDQLDPDNPPTPPEDTMSWNQEMPNGDHNPDGSDVVEPAWTLLHDVRVMAGQALAAIATIPVAVWSKQIDNGGTAEARLAAVQSLAEQHTAGGTVDVEALAASLAAQLGTPLVLQLGAAITKGASA